MVGLNFVRIIQTIQFFYSSAALNLHISANEFSLGLFVLLTTFAALSSRTLSSWLSFLSKYQMHWGGSEEDGAELCRPNRNQVKPPLAVALWCSRRMIQRLVRAIIVLLTLFCIKNWGRLHCLHHGFDPFLISTALFSLLDVCITFRIERLNIYIIGSFHLKVKYEITRLQELDQKCVMLWQRKNLKWRSHAECWKQFALEMNSASDKTTCCTKLTISQNSCSWHKNIKIPLEQSPAGRWKNMVVEPNYLEKNVERNPSSNAKEELKLTIACFASTSTNKSSSATFHVLFLARKWK